MKYILIGCKVLTRELYLLCARSKNVVEIRWMEAALHEHPKDLRAAIQREIDRIDQEADTDVDAILLGFGLCSMGIAGLKAGRVPLAAPRAHDCITLLLGSRARYQQLFDEHQGGVYWYSPGWIEQFKTPGRGYGDQEKYMDYVEKYGEDNAQYLIEVERGWTQNYSLAALIKWPAFPEEPYASITRKAAEDSGLQYLRAEGEDTILRKLIEGEWDGDILVLRPGQTLVYAGDERVICAKEGEES
ncbi:MAG: DUF1638 domain-containing protein [Clostridiales bacterium]|nr:DUF1638 domain-containing protein [Clostridiales bacterium]